MDRECEDLNTNSEAGASFAVAALALWEHQKKLPVSVQDFFSIWLMMISIIDRKRMTLLLRRLISITKTY